MKSPSAFGRSGHAQVWGVLVAAKSVGSGKYRKIPPDIKELRKRKSQCALSVLYPACLTLRGNPPTESHSHSLFEQTWGELQAPQSFAALYPSSLVCTIWRPAGISPDLSMRCLSSHRGVRFFKSTCPMSCWKWLASLLSHLNQIPRGSALLWCLAKSRKSSKKLGKPHQRDGEWRRE